MGVPVVTNALAGYNACVFAYGQTGSGKTHTMMGTPSDQGIIPRICRSIFSTAEAAAGAQGREVVFHVQVSYMEIYNEKVLDLLGSTRKASLLYLDLGHSPACCVRC